MEKLNLLNRKKETEQHNKYPFIFVHGMMGWGEDNLMYQVAPYWGMTCGNLVKQLRSKGYEAYAPQVGPINSAWDRACELYAILTGTKVDYGAAHSKKMKSERFGRKYDKPLVEGWGKPMEGGGIKKVHLLGHSFGGATMRVLVELLNNGCEAERKATPADELSPLFAGGHGDWVQSVTAISAPHDGTTFVHAFRPLMIALTVGTPAVFSILGNTKGNTVYDTHLENYKITVPSGQVDNANVLDLRQIPRIAKMVVSGNNVFHDLRIDSAAELNKHIHTCEDTYYFSIAGVGTKPDKNNPENEVRAPIMIFAFAPFAKVMGKFPEKEIGGVKVTKAWRPNDGLVPTESARYPHNEPHCIFEEVKDKPLQKGIWHVMPDYIADHGTTIGGSISYMGRGKSKPFKDYYKKHLEMLISLED